MAGAEWCDTDGLLSSGGLQVNVSSDADDPQDKRLFVEAKESFFFGYWLARSAWGAPVKVVGEYVDVVAGNGGVREREEVVDSAGGC